MRLGRVNFTKAVCLITNHPLGMKSPSLEPARSIRPSERLQISPHRFPYKRRLGAQQAIEPT
jgi:hypothetical protein